MKLILVAIFGFCCVANADIHEGCEKECLQAALTYRKALLEKVEEGAIEKYVIDDCERYSKEFKVNYECSKAVPMTLKNEKIVKFMKEWSADSPSDNHAVMKTKRQCRTSCRTAYFRENA